MTDTLGIMLLDEIDAITWQENIKFNSCKFNFLLIGCIGEKGKIIRSFEKDNVIVVNVSDRIYADKNTTDSSLRNILTNIVYTDSRFSNVGFVLNIDSDERIIGELPRWNKIKYPNGANCLYEYEYPFRNSKWLGCCGFFGRCSPRWMGDYHNAPQFLGHTEICKDFKIIHDRNSEHRRHDPVTDIIKFAGDDYYSKIAIIKNILDVKPLSQEYLGKAKNLIDSLPNIPQEITGLYRDMYLIQELMVRFKYSMALNDLVNARHHANNLVNLGQRIGLIYLWIAMGRIDTEFAKTQYRAFDILVPQFIDILDDSKLW